MDLPGDDSKSTIKPEHFASGRQKEQAWRKEAVEKADGLSPCSPESPCPEVLHVLVAGGTAVLLWESDSMPPTSSSPSSCDMWRVVCTSLHSWAGCSTKNVPGASGARLKTEQKKTSNSDLTLENSMKRTSGN